MVRRQRAVEAARARFEGGAFMLGRRDCGLLAAAVLKAMGHKLPKIPPYKTEVGARKALAKLGAETLADMLDGLGLQRIAPAAARLGDLLYMPGEGTVGALTIAQGNGAMFGFVEGHAGPVSMRSNEAIAAWSVAP